MAQGGGSKLWDLVTDRPIAKLAGPAEALERLQEEMVYKPLPEVRRLIFIATPHRGSPAIASGSVPSLRVSSVHPTACDNPMRRSWPQRPGYLPSGFPGGFTDEHRSACLGRSDVTGHRRPPHRTGGRAAFDHRRPEENSRARSGDGLVPYASAHLAGTASEFVVTAGHARREPRRHRRGRPDPQGACKALRSAHPCPRGGWAVSRDVTSHSPG